MSKNSFRPLAEFPNAGELLLAIRTLSHRFPVPGQGRHVWLSASTTGPDVAILTLKYGAIPVPEIRRLYPSDQVPESELHAMQYLHRKLGWRFHESEATVPNVPVLWNWCIRLRARKLGKLAIRFGPTLAWRSKGRVILSEWSAPKACSRFGFRRHLQ